MDMSKLKPYVIPVVSGYSFYIVQKIFWAYAIAYGPLAAHHEWLVSVMLPEHNNWYYIITYTRDILINVLLALPFAIPFVKLVSKQKVLALLIVIVPNFIYENSLILFDYQPYMQILFNSAGFYVGQIMTLGLLPFAIWFIGRFKNRGLVYEA
jgi:hypothetical protein